MTRNTTKPIRVLCFVSATSVDECQKKENQEILVCEPKKSYNYKLKLKLKLFDRTKTVQTTTQIIEAC